MSKKVTIPTDGMNPFVVTHNGEKYVFTPGETVEVSDGVALEIEEYKRWREKYYGTIDPPYEGGGDIEELIVTENGTYTPPEGVDGYAPVTVNVVPPASDIDALIDGSLTEITSGVESIRQCAFYGYLTLKNANFPNATSVGQNAFRECKTLISANLPLIKHITSGMFAVCNSLTSVNAPLSKMILANAFSDCKALTSVDFPEATTIESNVFQYCTTLKSVNFPKVTTVGQYAFRSCVSLESVDFPLVTTMYESPFNFCNKLKSANLPLLTKIPNYCFAYCYDLASVNVSSATTVAYNAFDSCSVLTNVDFPSVTSIARLVFSGCFSLTTLILRSETMCTLENTNVFTNCYHFHGTVNATYNPDGLKDGYIYVPRALIEDYKVATNWVTFADQFRALEDYTVDGTTTGELDESKVNA